MIDSNESSTSDVEETERTDLLLSDSEDGNYSEMGDLTSNDGHNSVSTDVSVSDVDDVPEFLARASYFKDSTAVELDFLSPDDAKVKKEHIESSKKKTYRCKIVDEQLYHQMLTSLAEFITPNELWMLWHKYDTSLNESLNNSIAAFAPKTANLSGSMSLSTRVCMAIGIHSKGRERFVSHILTILGVTISPAFATYLRTEDKATRQKTVYNNIPKNKAKRSIKLREKIMAELKLDAQAKLSGKTYLTGCALEHKTAKKVVLECFKNRAP